MTSRRLALLAAGLRVTAKPWLARTATPEQAERDFERAAALLRQPPNLRLLRRGAPRLAWISAGPCVPRRVVLWFHGGAYIAGSARTHGGMLGWLSALSGVEICAPEYRLAQEAPFPAAFEDACGAWEALAALGYAPDDILLGGDSAGGGLALALMARLLREGVRPRGLLAFSPWTDLALTGPSLAENARADPLLPVHRMEEVVEIVRAEADPRDPRLSPLYARFERPPPAFFQVGDTEILRDDTLRMAAALRAAGGEVETEIWPGVPHVWQIFDGWLPEARAALKKAARFVQSSFAATMR